jgi:hypothetical protein
VIPPERFGDWSLTYTGHHFYPYDPRVEDVEILDIAHHLARICRFGGAIESHYSVAQHSVLVSSLVRPADALCGLLHDATEAYLGDMIRPLKHGMPHYQQVEEDVYQVIAKRFGIYDFIPLSVKRADMSVYVAEERDLRGYDVHLDVPPYGRRIVPLPFAEAKKLFLDRFVELTGSLS